MKILFILLFAKSVMLRMLSSSSRPTLAGLCAAVCSAAQAVVTLHLCSMVVMRLCNALHYNKNVKAILWLSTYILHLMLLVVTKYSH